METHIMKDKEHIATTLVDTPEENKAETALQTNQEVKASTEETGFTRARVEALGNKIRLVDSDEETGLDLFCYTSCTDEDDDFLKQCRGLAFHGDQLVMKAFSYTPEYNVDQTEILEGIMADFSKWRFYEAHEGAILRLFYFSGRWFLSTHRKLNAFRSKWASRDSFGTLFKRALEAEEAENKSFAKLLPHGENILDRFQDTLDQSKQYMFLLRNISENRIVCQPPERPTLYHVGTFLSDGSLSMEEDCGIPQPQKYTFMNIDEMVNHIEHNVDISISQGLVCFGPDDKQIKVLHSDYQNLFRARGNEPSIKFRYLQVRMNRKIVDMLYYLYPKMAQTFDEYEDILYEIARSIHGSYVQRFIKKRFVNVPQEEYQVISACHDWYKSDRTNNRISLEKVINVLNKQSPTDLNRMIRRFKTEQPKKTAAHPRSYQGSRNNSPALVGLSPGIGPEMTPLLLKGKAGNLKLPPNPTLNKN